MSVLAYLVGKIDAATAHHGRRPAYVFIDDKAYDLLLQELAVSAPGIDPDGTIMVDDIPIYRRSQYEALKAAKPLLFKPSVN